MAVTKIIGSIHMPSKGGRYQILKSTIDYIMNSDKTDHGRYTGAFNCLLDGALEEMKRNMQYWHKEPKNKHDRIGYHFTISWRADCEITPETAMKITEEFCQELLSEYPLVYAVHTDKEHIHSHICFNSVSIIDGRKYHYDDNDWEKIIQPVTDKLCQKYGLNTLEMDRQDPEEEWEKEERKGEGSARNRKRSYKRKKYRSLSEEEKTEKKRSNTKYYKEETDFYSKMDHIRVDIDDAVFRSRSWEDFIVIMKNKEYKVKFGKYFSVLSPGMERYRRTYKLGPEYTEKAIKNRIAIHDQPLPDMFHREDILYFLNKDVRYKGKIKLTEQSRKHYIMQYSEGLLKPGQNRSYYVVRAALNRMRKAEQREKFLSGLDICDIQSAKKANAKYEVFLDEVNKEKEHFFEKRLPYMSLIRKYRECAKYHDSYMEFKYSGNNFFQEEAKKYESYLKLLKLNGVTADEFKQFYEATRAEMNRLNKKKRELCKEKKLVEEYLGEKTVKAESQDIEFQEKRRERLQNRQREK